MPTSTVHGVEIKGIASAVPETAVTVEDSAVTFDDARTIADSLGIHRRHVAPPGVCTSDLCFAAAQALMERLRWERETVDYLVFVSQYPDYLLPATSCCLHGRLGLSKKCAAFDINLGCSGYVYGLHVASSLVATTRTSRGLLLVGDTPTRTASPKDRSVSMLFGDAGTATALERTDSAPPMVFQLGTDGTGYRHLMVPAGGFRHPKTELTSIRREREAGNWRSDEDLFMNGAEIFAFTLREVPPLIKSILASSTWSIDTPDAVVMHQANRHMVQYLARKMKLPSEKVVMAMESYGNTSSASIPLAINTSVADRVRSGPTKLLLAGFGVGLSWGAATITCGPIALPEVVILPTSRQEGAQ